MYARHASRFSMRAGGGSVLASEAGWFAGAGADWLETCITSGAELAQDQSPQRLATNKLTTAMPDTFNFDPSLAYLSVMVGGQLPSKMTVELTSNRAPKLSFKKFSGQSLALIRLHRRN